MKYKKFLINGFVSLLLLVGACLPTLAQISGASPLPPIPSELGTTQFGQNGNADTSPQSQLIGTRPFVWAASTLQAGVATSYYVPCCRDPVSVVASPIPHTYAWYQSNHPDWPVFACGPYNQTIASSATGSTSSGTVIPMSSTAGLYPGWTAVASGIPANDTITAVTPNTSVTLKTAITGTVSGSIAFTCEASTPIIDHDNLVAVDISNPAVQQYMLNYAETNGIQAGFPYIALDNVDIDNNGSPARQGVYAGAQPGCAAGPPACGGIWVQQYAGISVDPAFNAVMFNYIQFLHTQLNAQGVGLAINLKADKNNIPGEISLGLNADVILHESPYLHVCSGSNTNFIDQSDGDWAANAQWDAELMQSRPVLELGYLCEHPLASITAPEATYGLGNFLLFAGPQSMLAIQNGAGTGTQDAGYFQNYADAGGYNLTRSIGVPVTEPPCAPGITGQCAPSTAWSGTAWERVYSAGLVEVCPYNGVTPASPISCTYTVPSGHTWQNMITGAPISPGSYTLSPDSSVSPARANAIIIQRLS